MLSRLIFALFCSGFFSVSLLAIEAKFKIGIVIPKSGPMAPLGEELMRGVTIAFEKPLDNPNEKLDNIQIVEMDDQGRSSVAAQVTEDLISQKKVHLLIGSISNTVNHAIADVASRKNRILILPIATDPDIMAKGKTIFTVSLNEFQQGSALGTFAKTRLKPSEAVIFAENENSFSERLSQSFVSAFKKNGGGDVPIVNYELVSEIEDQNLSQYRDHTVFIPGFYFDAKFIVNAFKKQNVSATFVGSDGWDTSKLKEVFGNQLAGHYFYTPYSLNDPHPAMQKFIASYRAKFGKLPSLLAFAGYEAFNLALFTYRQTKSNRTTPFENFLTKTQKLPSLIGPFRMNSSRSPIKPATIMITNSSGAQYMTKISP